MSSGFLVSFFVVDFLAVEGFSFVLCPGVDDASRVGVALEFSPGLVVPLPVPFLPEIVIVNKFRICSEESDNYTVFGMSEDLPSANMQTRSDCIK